MRTLTTPARVTRNGALNLTLSGVREVAVIGAGYVGLATALMMSAWGQNVRCFEKDRARANSLMAGSSPVPEPRVPELLRARLDSGTLVFESQIDVREAELIFICVGTPAAENGAADLTDLFEAVKGIGATMREGAIVVVKSTVPVGTSDRVEEILEGYLPAGSFSVVSNPEFLRQGRIIEDTERPDRIVIGASTREEAEVLARLYRRTRSPIVISDRRTAELTKYAANAFLATRVSFINEIAHVAESVGADVKQLADAIGMDRRIGRDFLDAGIGYGGSCLPKDVSALRYFSHHGGCPTPLLDAVSAVNDEQLTWFVSMIEDALGSLAGKKVALLGLAFKAQTGDHRGSVAVEVVSLLEQKGAKVRVYDPAIRGGSALFTNGTKPAADALGACTGADAVVIATEWPEFARLDWRRIRQLVATPYVFDGRNVCSPEELERWGFQYFGVGRNGHSPGKTRPGRTRLPGARHGRNGNRVK